MGMCPPLMFSSAGPEQDLWGCAGGCFSLRRVGGEPLGIRRGSFAFPWLQCVQWELKLKTRGGVLHNLAHFVRFSLADPL